MLIDIADNYYGCWIWWRCYYWCWFKDNHRVWLILLLPLLWASSSCAAWLIADFGLCI